MANANRMGAEYRVGMGKIWFTVIICLLLRGGGFNAAELIYCGHYGGGAAKVKMLTCRLDNCVLEASGNGS